MFKQSNLPEVIEKSSDSAWLEFERAMMQFHAHDDDGFPDTVPMEYEQPEPQPVIDWDKVTLEPLKKCRRF